MDRSHSNASAAQPGQGARRTGLVWLLLLLGDSISFIVFAMIGRSSHGRVTELEALLEIVPPFLVVWLLVAPLLGAFRLHRKPAASEHAEQAASSGLLRAFLWRTVLAWVIACPLGLGLRALYLQRSIPLTFAIVTFLSNLVLLVGWRALFGWLFVRRFGSRADSA